MLHAIIRCRQRKSKEATAGEPPGAGICGRFFTPLCVVESGDTVPISTGIGAAGRQAKRHVLT